ncbi:ABC transporter substrate-binding protein [Nocardioides sp.]|uniref:ABC transporter substrate-binding protein n=1 Tax=Nocardioides sp. TaxID=35761 RepID=UPI0039E27871
MSMKKSQHTKPRRSIAMIAALVVGLSMALAACGGGDSSEGGAGTTSLVIGNWQDPASLDPGAITENSMNWVVYSMFDPLVWAVADDDGEPSYVSGLAESWESSDDMSSWTFKLREGVTFHDGTALDANAVKATFDRIVDPNFSSTKGKALLAAYKQTVVVDDMTVRVELTGPSASFLDAVASPQLVIVSPQALQDYSNDLSTHPVGTGFMKLDSFTKGDSLVVTRNPDYAWGPDGVWSKDSTIEKLTFRFLPDQQARGNALRSGAVDLSNRLSPQDAGTFQKDSAFTHYPAVARGVNYSLVLNTSRAPFDDLRVRQAIFYAIDRKQLVDTLGGGAFTLAQSIVSSAVEGYDPDSQDPYPYDLDKAKSLLDEAGWVLENGVRQKDGQTMKLELISVDGFGMESAGPYVQELLKTELGIEVDVSSMKYPAISEVANAGNLDITNYSFLSLNALVTYQTTWDTSQIEAGFNYSHFSDPELDDKVRAIEAIADPTARSQQWKEVFDTVAQAAVHLPMWELTGDWYSAVGDVKGLAFSPLDGSPYFHGVGS